MVGPRWGLACQGKESGAAGGSACHAHILRLAQEVVRVGIEGKGEVQCALEEGGSGGVQGAHAVRGQDDIIAVGVAGGGRG